MPPLQGLNLGQRHAYYNQLVKEAEVKMTADLPKIDYEESDVDNLIKIDLACKARNVDYILDVLKGDDMLYISRVIKKSPWLTEAAYAHIINPKYMNKELFPYMKKTAISKLMLHIRLHLKDEIRAKSFYWYTFQKNRKQAWRWLQYCPLKFIRSRFRFHSDASDIPPKHAMRLTERNFTEAIIKELKSTFRYEMDGEYRKSKCLLKTHTDTYLEIGKHFAKFNEKRTKFLMQKCPQRIMDNYEWYDRRIHTDTFFKYLYKEGIDLQTFCIKLAKSKACSWNYYNLWPFLKKIPRDQVLDFLKNILAIRKGTFVQDSNETPKDSSDAPLKEDSEKPNEKERGDLEELFFQLEGEDNRVFSNVYRWYEFAPFELAFPDIRRFVFTESVPEERHAMLIVLLTCASYDFEHVKTVIKYYHDKHINEPYIHKIKFVESVLNQHSAFRFDDLTWELVNNLFKSLEVYIESTNKVQQCLICVILYNVLRDQPVPEVVEDKFLLESLKGIRNILNTDEQNKIFNYLYKLHVKKLENQSTDSETGLHEAMEILKKVWALIKDWEKLDTHRQLVIDKIAEFGNVNRNSKWNKTIKLRRLYRRKLKIKRRHIEWGHFATLKPYIDIPSIYHMVKPYRKELFENSLILHTCEDVCLNSLKHDPGLLERYKTEIEDLRIDNRAFLNRFLSKLRIYWPDTLATQWAKASMEKLSNKSDYKPLIRGLLVVLPHSEVLDFIQAYAPDDHKIEWKGDKDTEISIQKVIAKSMHLTRPQLSIEEIMLYAKGDYLQFSLRSLLNAYSTIRSKDIREYIEILLKAPVAIQKHGIRLAFKTFKLDELITRSESIWISTRNDTIRTIIFTAILDLLCKEINLILVNRLWKLLSIFIDDLSKTENTKIYNAMGDKTRAVPYSVIGEYFPKVYWFLKDLLPRDDTIKLKVEHMFNYTADIIEYLDCDFVEKLLLCDLHGSRDLLLDTSYCRYLYLHVLTNYLLFSKDVTLQMRKYDNLLRPLVEACKSNWKRGDPRCKKGFSDLLHHICRAIPNFVFNKNMVMPLDILTHIKDSIVEGYVPTEKFYALTKRWEMELAYLKLIESIKSSKTEECSWEQIRTESMEPLGKLCLDWLTEDMEQFYPSIYLLFREPTQNLFNDFNIEGSDKFQLLDTMLNSNNEYVYLFVLYMMPSSHKHRKFDVIMSKIFCHPSQEINFHYIHKCSTEYAEIVQENEDVQ